MQRGRRILVLISQIERPHRTDAQVLLPGALFEQWRQRSQDDCQAIPAWAGKHGAEPFGVFHLHYALVRGASPLRHRIGLANGPFTTGTRQSDDASILDLEVPGRRPGSEGCDPRNRSLQAQSDFRRTRSRGDLQQRLLSCRGERCPAGCQVRLEGIGAEQPQNYVEGEQKERGEQEDRQQPHEQVGDGQFPAHGIEHPVEQIAPEVHEHRPQRDDEDRPGVRRPRAGKGPCRGKGGDRSDPEQ